MEKTSQSKEITVSPTDRQEWRNWLAENHRREQSVWLVYHKVKSGVPSIRYDEAVEEALCFGWIDSKAQTLDENRYRQLFTVRKPKSVWSKVNKEKVARLQEQGLMTEAGLESIAIARQNGSWESLDEAENLVIPDDLGVAFRKQPGTAEFFESLSRTTRRNLLQWLSLARKQETRQKRIEAIVGHAGEGTVPDPFRSRPRKQ